ncbi:cytochrome-c peroxidase [Pontibacter beigongshangensis]|uniref:cytochrome-c peroxidase n=1 Tax=Pontibacter beigongshangensis TaxID=2574733 RepID=UPI001650A9A8|nr:cytochrome c peroxidase [Pontibacter beigongshangensis]
MRKGTFKSFFLLLSTCIFVGAAISSFTAELTPYSKVTGNVKNQLLQDVTLLQQQAKQLTAQLQLLEKQQTSVAAVQAAFAETETAYKQVEYLLEYLDPQLAKNLNGAPLPRVVVEQQNYQTLQFTEPSFRTFPPEGLQVLEEMLFAEELTPETAQEALALAYMLQENMLLFANSLPKLTLTDKQLLESLREELVRAMAMGITGFDEPAAGKALENTAMALQPVLAAVQRYERTTTGAARTRSATAAQYLQKAIQYLQQHPNFDTFDRLHFIRELADPAYAALTALQQELLREPASAAKPVHDHASSLFSADFLQPGYYAKQDQRAQQPELVELGNLLFFDPALSANNQRSCASCHSPQKGFADGLARSVAFDFKGNVKRNSPTLLNAMFSTAYFWDGRAQYLQDQVPDVVVNTDELHGDYKEVEQKLQQSPAYKQLFRRAFSGESGSTLTTNNINRAIAAYVQQLVALDSPFDRYMRRQTEQLPDAAKRGFNLFMGKAACGTCHFAPVFNGTVPPRFTESETEVLGVPATADFAHASLDSDPGKAGVIPAEAWQHSFKTPTVRNAAVTAPYMHNGAFATLEEVVEFYELGGGIGLGLDVPNQTLPGDPLNLTVQEKLDLIAFMETLTDTTAASSAPERLPKFSTKANLNNRKVGGSY